jgi:hypothetical protein
MSAEYGAMNSADHYAALAQAENQLRRARRAMEEARCWEERAERLVRQRKAAFEATAKAEALAEVP